VSIAERIRINLPSRKPQLWENLPLAIARRAERSVRMLFDPLWVERSSDVSLPSLGFRMAIIPRYSFIDGFIYSFGIYEISGTRLLEGVLQPGMTVIDVGANTGYYSLLASRLVGETGHVHSFEPVPALARALRRNVELNGMKNIAVRSQAISDSVGTASLYVSRASANSGLSSLVMNDAVNEGSERLEVETVSIDDLVRQLDKPIDFIKIDVEGAEDLVFRGSEQVLASSPAPTIMFESYNVGPIADRLHRHGYDIRRLHYTMRSGIELRPIGEKFDDLFDGYEGINFVAVKSGDSSGAFDKICATSRTRIPAFLRLLAAWV
jgi:FkbM family methyltransferase